MEQNFYWTSKVHENMNDAQIHKQIQIFTKKNVGKGRVKERRTNVLKKLTTWVELTNRERTY